MRHQRKEEPVIPVTVCLPVIPPRVGNGMLDRALRGVREQTLQPAAINCVLDTERQGAAATREKALRAAETEWVAYLDDDDFWHPHHLETLWNLAEQKGAWYVWSWFDGNNPFPMHRGRQMNIDDPHHTTMGIMVKRELSLRAGFMPHPEAPPEWAGEDWWHELRCIELLRKEFGDEVATKLFAGSPEVTWTYYVHSSNTSGRPRW
jgi:glycosyltransferase involved in cell wall biosynthesis